MRQDIVLQSMRADPSPAPGMTQTYHRRARISTTAPAKRKPLPLQPDARKVQTCRVRLLREQGFGRITRAMMRFFDMDDRARLPWRFYGATVSILARR